MRDSGLSEAVRAIGGVNELARPPFGSSAANCDRVSEEQLPAAATAKSFRDISQSDRPAEDEEASLPKDETEQARARQYALLSVLLARAPDCELLRRIAQLRGDASPLGVAHVALAQAAGEHSVEHIEREYFNLFIGLGRGEILPYGSYYLTGFLHERPLARLRADLAPLGIERVEGNFEPEDHAATLCEIMAGLVSGELPAPEGCDRQIFEKHLSPWIGRFFADLERADAARFYRHVGTVGRVFVDIEKRAFALPS